MKLILKSIWGVLIFLSLVFAILMIPIPNYDSLNVNSKAILSIKMGDPIPQVLKKIGEPKNYTIQSNIIHEINCRNSNHGQTESSYKNYNLFLEDIKKVFADSLFCCNGSLHKNYLISLGYTKEVGFPFRYPMVWIHFDKTQRAIGVYIKEYTTLDDVCIYDLHCEQDMSQIGIYEKIDFYWKKDMFESMFSQ